MKKLTVLAFGVFLFGALCAQQSFTVPEVTPDQEKEILYNHVVAYFAAGLTFAKTQDVSVEEYGKYIGEQFKVFWDPEAGFAFFVNQIMFILKGVNPYSEMKIVEQNDKMIRFQMANLGLIFKQGPMYGITYDEFITCSGALISTIAEHMNVSFKQKVDNDGLYIVTLKAR
ncbi:hypothetical protein OU798_01255 [Prolixibacteraceae bacterium Z1-6]|uniref:Uncharacterized protein n=1 Tax=Draconibacterium aestuarii TaxID=2998507 RepID=A0A9X3J444_9BACT|nr:hypothetical protein [Prolixibacteraceae bacterium Z1-6]